MRSSLVDPQAIAIGVARVQERVADAARRSGRDPDEVTIIAVAKRFPPDAVRAALDAGIGDIGENRAQELRDKRATIGDAARWHFVGHLQTNKVRQVVGAVTLIHSIDRIALATEVARRARLLGITQDVLIEVNVAGEATKRGVEPPRALEMAEAAAALDGIAVRGLMTVPPPPSVDPEDSRPYLEKLAELRDLVVQSVPEATALSMGMTDDLEVAVACGATHVRVGRAIFGPRP